MVIKRSSKKAGSAPGTLVFVGEKKVEKNAWLTATKNLSPGLTFQVSTMLRLSKNLVKNSTCIRF
jgi:hypothetical protein